MNLYYNTQQTTGDYDQSAEPVQNPKTASW